ncbi:MULTISPECIES: bifunctional lysylphosphatidylglycerol flippase/synthetase MprF [unclassified Ruegeria]|uniref:bifunctional lysylphosphatidylglycerol flippase/synthetase MprF n=1 Tax=unclassified Ruegeria TaxID=2625375 RepID=UPI001AD9B139|nr:MULTISPECIES: bifunctional lysylphosphatidylglycerol flippase/synthetase MprF [unclassified Ruegeria]MBO9412766.1 bifunctional lysylphosphatidylglycerol flippase/synthetase MprF [Ruegeria sp. R8_1]MBO9416686.1 bifunctional lysylphosphatidylglycerol flippase/synthetase MprF [Ruegeria sp. R8_2]
MTDQDTGQDLWAVRLAERVAGFLERPWIKILVPVLVMLVALTVLHELSSHVKWSDVQSDVANTSWKLMFFALCWTMVSFLSLSLYDVFAVQSVADGEVPLPVAGMAGACGYAVSNCLGFSYITGTAIRYRIYASLGLDLSRVAGVIATSWIAFWSGMVLLLGTLLTLHPDGISKVIPISDTTETVIGLCMLAALLGLFLWLANGGRRLAYGGVGFNLPNGKLASLLTLAALGDLFGASMVLYTLMPSDLGVGFPYFFTIFIAAIAVGIVSHAPGGIGAFEATMIAGLGASGRSDVIAALLLYRLVYTFLPFVIASLSIAVASALSHRHHITGAATWVYRVIRPIVPMVAAGVAAVAGVILLVSGALPASSENLGVLRDVLPLSFVEASHLVGSAVGVLLLLVSRGLFRKLYRAWVVAMLLMVAGFGASIAKGLDTHEAISMLATIGVLAMFRDAFYRVSGASIFRLNIPWLVSVMALLAVVFWIGLFAYSHVEYQNALWWEFAWNGDASRFLRSSLVVAVILGIVAVTSLFGREIPMPERTEIPAVVERLVMESEDTESQISLTGDKQFLIAPDESAFLAYADTGNALITKGEPVGDEKAGQQLIWQLREMADREGKLCAFYSVSTKYLPTFLDLGLSILKIGEVARVPLKDFSLDGKSRKRFRQAKNRAEREGYVFEIIRKENLAPILPELRKISDDWLAQKAGEEKGFALGGFDDDYLSYFDHAALRESEGGRIVAFANLFQGGHKSELSLDLMRYEPDSASFVMDALFAEMMAWGAEQGFQWFSLGAAPFSGIENRQLASFWNRVGGFVYEHGEQFYHFEGLRSFKQKFDPEWSPNYLASPGGLAAPRILYEVNILISGGLRGLTK